MRTRTKVATAAAAAVATIGAGVGVAQFAAAEPTPTPAPSGSSSAPADSPKGPRGGGHDKGGPAGFGADTSALAKKLGVSEEKLKTALDQARDAAGRPEKPASGATEAERQAAHDAREAALAKALAEKLGVSEAKVTAALAELKAAREADAKAGLKTRLDQAVTDGKLTRAEADAVAKAADAGVIGYGGHR